MQESNKYYIYHLIDPKDNMPFYVGKGYGKRMYSHEKETKRGILPNKNSYLFNSIKEILSKGLNIVYKKIKENLYESESFKLESDEIQKYGRKNNNTGILCNMTDGGEGMSGHKHTESSKKKMSDSLKGKYTWSSLRREKISNLFSGKGNPFYGKKHTKECLDKLSKISKEKYIGKIHPLKGIPKSLEHRKKLSKYKTGRILSEETKRKMSITKQNIYKIDNNIKNKIIDLYKSGIGCKTIIKKLKNEGFPYTIAIVKRELKKCGFDLNKRNIIPIKIKTTSNIGEINIFDSCRSAEKFLGCGRSNLNKILKRGGKYKCFFIEKLSVVIN